MTIASKNIVASDDAEVLADWLEMKAIHDLDHAASENDMRGILKKTGSAEAFEHSDEYELNVNDENETLELCCDAVFGHLQQRESWMGLAYPFAIGDGSITFNPDHASILYKFALILSSAKDAARFAPHGKSGAKLFEHLALEAGTHYFGSDGRTANFPFGFPRATIKGFGDAIDEFCRACGEGTGAKRSTGNFKAQKDGTVDLAFWRDMPDSRAGKLFAFGQCAAGDDWFDKLHELDPRSWVDLWMEGALHLKPVKVFFTPRVVPSQVWDIASSRSGIVIDRIRLISLVEELHWDGTADVARWVTAAESELYDD